MLTRAVENQTHRAFTHFRGKLVRRLAQDAPSCSGAGASGKPGAVHSAPRGGVTLIGIPNEHRTDEIAAALHAVFRWMGAATEVVWHAMQRSVQSGDAGLRLSPVLRDGPPGTGKSHWAGRLYSLIGVPGMIDDTTTENAPFGRVGWWT